MQGPLPGYSAEPGALHKHTVPNLTLLSLQENNTSLVSVSSKRKLCFMGLIFTGDIQWFKIIAAIVSEANPVPAVIG